MTKIRLQVNKSVARPGVVATAREIFVKEGVSAFYYGVPAAVIRQAVYGGIGVGMYRPVRAVLLNDAETAQNAPLWKRMLAGAITGGFGQAVATPTDVVKIRLQADGQVRRYRNTFHAFCSIPRQEGIFGLYKGVGPSIQRAAVINGSGIATYDHAKQFALRLTQREEGAMVHVIASLCSGLVSALVSNPIDVVKTRIMNTSKDSGSSIRVLLDIVRTEGVSALYKGFIPSYARLAPWQLSFFLTYEALNRHLLGETI